MPWISHSTLSQLGLVGEGGGETVTPPHPPCPPSTPHASKPAITRHSLLPSSCYSFTFQSSLLFVCPQAVCMLHNVCARV